MQGSEARASARGMKESCLKEKKKQVRRVKQCVEHLKGKD